MAGKRIDPTLCKGRNISMSDETLAGLDKVQEALTVRSRSEAVKVMIDFFIRNLEKARNKGLVVS